MQTRFAERIEQSERLHRRVRAFAVDELARRPHLASSAELHDGFLALACDIARFQTSRSCDDLVQLVSGAVPADCFKFGHVFQFPTEAATCSFRTSGTTAANTGVHLMRDAATYQQLSLSWGSSRWGSALSRRRS